VLLLASSEKADLSGWYLVLITRSLHNVHEINAYRTGHVCLSVCPHDLTREPLDGFG
jgi:hypothetical protein